MSARLTSIFVLMIGLGGYFWFENRSPSPSKLSSTAPEKLLRSKQHSTELLSAPRDILPKPSVIKISADCAKAWNEIQSLKSEDFAALKVPSISACQNVPPRFAAVTMQYLNACNSFLAGSVGGSEKEKNDCRSALYTYRATITDFNTADQDVDEISDLRILIDKLIASFGAGGDIDGDRMAKTAERIHRLAPDLYEPVKAMVVAKFSPIFKGEKDPVRQADAFAQIEKAIQEAEEFNPADPDLWEARLLARSRLAQDLDRADEVVSEMRQVKGLEGLTDYFQAGIEWKRKNVEASKTLIERAIQRDPKNERYLNVYEKMKSAKPGEPNIFEASIRFSFDFEPDQNKN